ncbi:MBL fold metallo-hydrolase [Candidatus Woesearchaeota archaeon]|jgi:glyoxylase-like metal-dependent hydrolase (beta-lactamase superfamily II)|nr:MBL fold metallo-hydrolase [Candidatus Woesearchaeota archaeon]
MRQLANNFFQTGTSLIIEGTTGLTVIDPGWDAVGSTRTDTSVHETYALARHKDKPITRVILSHNHQDHCANLQVYLRQTPDLELIVGPHSPFKKFADQVIDINPGKVKQVIDGIEETIFVTPGHSKQGDDISIYFPQPKILFCGDLAQPQGESYAKTDFVTPLPFYYDGDLYLASLSLLKSVDFDILVTGHGQVLGNQRGYEWLDTTQKTIKRTQELATQLVRDHPTKSDLELGRWILETIGYERNTPKSTIRARSNSKDFEDYDFQGIKFWLDYAKRT